MAQKVPHDGGGSGGRALAALLARLGYDRGDLSDERCDALFALPSMRVQGFLEWFLAAFGSQHSVPRQLSEHDRQIYDHLVDTNALVLDEHELATRESAFAADVAANEPLEALLAQNASLEGEVAQLEAQLQRCTTRGDRLGKMVQRAALRADASARRAQQSGEETEHFREITGELDTHRDGSKQQAVGERHRSGDLSAQIDEIVDLLAVTSQHDDSADYPMHSSSFSSSSSSAALSTPSSQWREYLYQQPLAELQEMELRNLDALKAQVATVVLGAAHNSHAQRDEGMLALAAADSDTKAQDESVLVSLPTSHDLRGQRQSPPSWLQDADPEALELHEQDALVYNKCSLELARLEKAFAIGEQDALHARLQLAKYEALHAQLSDPQRALFQRYELASADALRAKSEQLAQSIASTKRELRHLVQTVLPKAFDEMAFLRSTTILLSSYERKLWRQEHRFLKLRGLLDAFDHQHGRLTLAHRFLDAERQEIEAVDATLSGVVSQLASSSAEIRARLELSAAYADGNSTAYSSRSAARASIPDADEIAHALFDYLQHRADRHRHPSDARTDDDNSDAHPPPAFRVRTFDELVRLCERKRADDASVAESLERVDHEWLALYDAQHSALVALRRELFGDATSATPTLMPPRLAALLQEAVASKERAEQALHAALESLRLKKRALAMDPTTRQQQQENFLRLQQQLAQRLQGARSRQEGS